MWLGPVNLAYPDGKLPVFHDSDPVNLKNYKSYFLWAYEYFKESVFAQYAGIEVSHTQIKNPESVNLSDIGIAVLRRGKGADQVCAMLDYGIHGDAHGHPDKLNIVLYALGRELMLDPGRISYSVPEYRTWCRTTVAHNTVVVDGKDQQPATGKLLYFGETEHYSACLAVCDSAYPGYVIKRFLALFDTFLIDFLTVEGKEKKQMDWIIHCRGKILHKNGHRLFESLGDKNGYQHLKDIQKHDNISQDVYQFVQEDGKILRVFLPDEKNYEIFTGTGIGYHLKDKVAFLLRRGCSEKAGFIAVYDFSETEQDRIKKIERIPVISCDAKKLLKDKAIGLRILTGSKIFTIGMDMRENIKDLPAVGNKKFERFSMNVENISSGNN